MRRSRNYKRDWKPDLQYNSVAVTRFINCLMKEGKRSVAERVIYTALDLVKTKSGAEPLPIFEKALENVSPTVEVVTKRIGGANYQVPREVRQERRFSLAVRWLIGAAKKKTGKPMAERLAEELVLAAKNEGASVKKKQDTHRMAEANRAFAHFAR